MNTTIEEFKRTEPTYFEALRLVVLSKDVVKIDQILSKGGEVFSKLIKIDTNTTTHVNQGRCLYVWNAGAVVNVAAVDAAVYAGAYWWRGLDTETFLLEKEIFISDIANL